ncbi:MAG: IS4 family transposase [Bacillaceae bacterium]|nr:IS4 family transposase [Bacillaceae bacterium]
MPLKLVGESILYQQNGYKSLCKTVGIIQELTKDCKGINGKFGRLKIIDSTLLKLPTNLCDWAYISSGLTGVKMHTSIVVVSEETLYPDEILPSTGIVGDSETVDRFVVNPDETLIVDRAYPSKQNLMKWLEDDTLFLARLSKNLKVFPLEEYEVIHPRILKDAKVLFGISKKPVRIVEFEDEEKKLYRLVTTRWDLSAEEVMDLYRYRWMIETFFRWIKGHLKLVKVWSHSPQGVWNQMFLALTAFNLAVILQLQSNTKKTLWEFLRSMRTYMHKTWKQFLKAVRPKKKTASKGKQKVPKPKEKVVVLESTVAMIKTKEKK